MIAEIKVIINKEELEQADKMEYTKNQSIPLLHLDFI